MTGSPPGAKGASHGHSEGIQVAKGRGASAVLPRGVAGVVWDWGDTLMRDLPGQTGPMVDWPRVEAMPGALAALRALSSYRLRCVATNATESDGEMVALALARVGLRQELTHFLASVELGFSKPDPRFFEEVARRLGVSPTQLVAVGNDYEKDVVPAKAAGMTTILVSEQAPMGSGGAADLVVPDLAQLARLMAG